MKLSLRFTLNRALGPVAHTTAIYLTMDGVTGLSVPLPGPISLEGTSTMLQVSALLSSTSCDGAAEFCALDSELVSLPSMCWSRFPDMSSSPLSGSLALSLSDVDSHFSGLPLGRTESWLAGVCASSLWQVKSEQWNVEERHWVTESFGTSFGKYKETFIRKKTRVVAPPNTFSSKD